MEYLPFILISLGFCLGIVFLVIDIHKMIWILIVMTMAVSGTVSYFIPATQKILWINVLISFFLLVKIFFCLPGLTHKVRVAPPYILICMFIFVISATTSVLINFNFVESLFASKNMFQFWPVPLTFFLLIEKTKFVNNYFKFFIILAVLMPIVTLIQYIVFDAHYDIITGTFGSSYVIGGGPNAVLSVFVVAQIGSLLALAQKNFLQWKYAFVLSLVSFITIPLTFAKGSVIFLFCMLIFLFWKDLLKFSIKSYMIALLIALMLFFTIYKYYDNSLKQNKMWVKPPSSVSEFINRSIENNFSFNVNSLNRLTVLTFWWKETKKNRNFINLIFGHGIGSTKRAGYKIGHIQKKYQDLKIGFTALSSLLWDVGLFGTLVFCCIFLVSFFTAGKLKNNHNIPAIHRTYLNLAQLNTLFFLMTLPYKDSIIENQAFNFYSMFIIGYICFWYKVVSSRERELMKTT